MRPKTDHQTSLLRPCARCGSIKEYDLFHIHPMSKDGRNSWCKQCDTEARQERSKNPEWRKRRRATEKAHRVGDPILYRAGQLNRKAKKLGLPGTVTKPELEGLWARHGGKCFLRGPDCLGDASEWDHATPVTRHGATGDIHNLYPACRRCNAQKSTMTLTEWRRELMWRQLGDGSGWIHPLALVGEPPEHRDYLGAPGLYPEIAPTAIVDAFCSVDAGITEPTRIGERTWLQKRVHVGHDCQIGNDTLICVGVVLCGHVQIGDNVQIAGNSWVRPRIKIGDGAVIGGGSVVVKDIPPGAIVAGNPAVPLERGRKFRKQELQMWNDWWDKSRAEPRSFPDTEEVWEHMRPWHHRGAA